MATEALQSTPISNGDAQPEVRNNAGVQDGILRQSVATIEHAGGDLGSTYAMMRIPSNATGMVLVLAADDAGATGDIDIGIYQATEHGGLVVDADFFASAVDVNAAVTTPTEVQHESGVYGVEDVEKPLWEALGLSADSMRDYFVVITSTEALGTASTMSLRLTYTK